AYFEYANLNYVLLGAALERATGERLDHLMRREVLERIGARGGLNWAGVTEADRADRLPLYQRHGDALVLEADGDGAAWDADLIWRGGRGLSLDGYRTGLDTGLLSPHAGLRLTVGEMARLARLFGEDSAAARLQRRETWRYDGTNGAWCDGLFPAFGLGLTLTPGGDRIPGRLAGHAGHALGFTGGAWVNLDTGTAWAYALTGSADLTEDSDQEVFYPEPELAILEHF
ncbi:MAG: serine hydrolase domain-containing protein, partial [Pseudomonadota bacterium]